MIVADFRLKQDISSDRRSRPRLSGRFPATVRGLNRNRDSFEIHAVIDNIGAGGLYMRLRQDVEPGETLFLVTRLTSDAGEVHGPLIAINGNVLRAEPIPSGECGVAVAITNHRFL